MKTKFLDELEKTFEEHEIKIVQLNKTIIWKDKKLKTQTISVNGQQIAMAWSPRLEKMRSNDALVSLIRDCKIKIQELLNEKKSKSGEKVT